MGPRGTFEDRGGPDEIVPLRREGGRRCSRVDVYHLTSRSQYCDSTTVTEVWYIRQYYCLIYHTSFTSHYNPHPSHLPPVECHRVPLCVSPTLEDLIKVCCQQVCPRLCFRVESITCNSGLLTSPSSFKSINAIEEMII